MSTSVDLETAIRQISRGRDLVTQLRSLPPPSLATWQEPTEILFQQVVGAFDTALHILTAGEKMDTKVKRREPVKMEGGGGGGDEMSNKKRKSDSTWSTFTSNPHDDGYQWRKYGEKPIQGDKFRRSYYRCTYKYDQGCQATKQVQRDGKDVKSMAFVTYKHQHTCKVVTSDAATPSITGKEDFAATGAMSSDPNPMNTNKQQESFRSSLSDAPAKHEVKPQEEECEVDDLGNVDGIPSVAAVSSGSINDRDLSLFDSICSHCDLQDGLDYELLNIDVWYP